MRSQNLYCKLVQKATAADPFEALAAEIDRDPAVRAIRLLLYASRNRASTVAIRAVRPPPLPPPRRCQCRPPHRASKNAGGDDDAR
jgi:hypothetical protein